MILSRKLKLAHTLSAFAHDGQTYGEYDYYFTHIMDVAHRVGLKVSHLSECEQEDYLIVAYLHDVLEDTELTVYCIEELFGFRIADSVTALSKTYRVIDHGVTSYRTSKIPYEQYIAEVKDDPVALLVKICDTEANLAASIADGNQKRIDKYTKQLEMLLE